MAYARNTDPHTSHLAGQGARDRSLPQRDILLLTHYEYRSYGLTDEEAGTQSGLRDKPGCCYWKRCSELRQMGLISVVHTRNYLPSTRTSRAGEQQQVCELTETGLERVRTLLSRGYAHTPRDTTNNVEQGYYDPAYYGWLQRVAKAASLVSLFDGTDRVSLDQLREALNDRVAEE